MDRSLRRRGQLLVAVGALLGAFVGITLGLAVGHPEAATVLAAPGPDRGAAVAASPPSTRAVPPPVADVGGRTDGNDPRGGQRAESTDRPDKRHGKAGKDDKGGRDKPGGRGDEPGKAKKD